MSGKKSPEIENSAGNPKLRVFVVENRDLDLEGLKSLIEQDPENRMELVGTARRNSDDLVGLIRSSGADVVTVDLALGGVHTGSATEVIKVPLTSGIEAIRAIRQNLGLDVRIVALSGYPQLRGFALEAGADQFCDKGNPFDEIRRIIQGGAEWSAGKPSGLELFLGGEGRYRFRVLGQGGKTEMLILPPIQFVFLAYLAAERRRGTNVPLLRAGSLGYRPANVALWKELVTACEAHAEGLHLQNQILSNPAVWRSLINKAVEPFLPPKVDLIIGPGKRGAGVGYALNPNIPSTGLVFHGGTPSLSDKLKK